MQFPLTFEVSTTAEAGIKKKWEAQAEDFSPIVCSIPKQFQGEGDGYSPEDLLALAGLNCLIATFKVFAEKSKLSFEKISGHAVLTIDRLERKPIAITKIDFKIMLKGATDAEMGKKLLEEAKKNCLVTNVLQVEKTYSFEVN